MQKISTLLLFAIFFPLQVWAGVGDSDNRYYVTDEMWATEPYKKFVHLNTKTPSGQYVVLRYCSAQYVSKNLILSAGHCTKNDSTSNYTMDTYKDEDVPLKLIYSAYKYEETSPWTIPGDWAVFLVEDKNYWSDTWFDVKTPDENVSDGYLPTMNAGWGYVRIIKPEEMDIIRNFVETWEEQNKNNATINNFSAAIKNKKIFPDDVDTKPSADIVAVENAFNGIEPLRENPSRLKASNCNIVFKDCRHLNDADVATVCENKKSIYKNKYYPDIIGSTCDIWGGNSGGGFISTDKKFIYGVASSADKEGSASFSDDGSYSFMASAHQFSDKIQELIEEYSKTDGDKCSVAVGNGIGKYKNGVCVLQKCDDADYKVNSDKTECELTNKAILSQDAEKALNIIRATPVEMGAILDFNDINEKALRDKNVSKALQNWKKQCESLSKPANVKTISLDEYYSCVVTQCVNSNYEINEDENECVLTEQAIERERNKVLKAEQKQQKKDAARKKRLEKQKQKEERKKQQNAEKQKETSTIPPIVIPNVTDKTKDNKNIITDIKDKITNTDTTLGERQEIEKLKNKVKEKGEKIIPAGKKNNRQILNIINETIEYQVDEERLKELQAAYDEARANEQSLANRMLTAATVAATGIGGMELARGLAEQSADKAAEQDMAAYVSTFRCTYGDGKQVKAGPEEIELPGGNDATMMSLRNEYFSLAKDLKERKEALGLTPGIESETILDKSEMGLYDDENVGIESGAYASIYRATVLDNETDQTKINEDKEASQKRVTGGGVAAGVGAVGSIVGNGLINGFTPEDNNK